MGFKINKKFLPIKLHYFFFMAALGPILPQIQVFGRQMGVSASASGIILAILPFLYFFAKPLVGMLADYFIRARKLIFISIILIMTISFGCYLFLPYQINKFHANVTEVQPCTSSIYFDDSEECLSFHSVRCDHKNSSFNFKVTTKSGHTKVLCNQDKSNLTKFFDNEIPFECHITGDNEASICFYKSFTFWMFVLLTYFGIIGFNVGNSISDAICFDVLGDDNQSKYGKQRVWGSISYGITSLIAGYAVDNHSNDFTPAILIMLAFASVDLIIIKNLKLPKLSSPESLTKDIIKLVKNPKIALFLTFATIVGIFDSFIFYYMFWYLEEVAEQTGMKDHIKLIEGVVVAVECIFGEVLFFIISGKIIKKLGYIHTMSFCLFCYSLRMLSISFITNPWHLVAIEIFMQGSTYALCYTAIVAYASVITPPGASASVQGLVAGMDDGLGFTIGSLFGGILYEKVGGKTSFRVFSFLALIACLSHIFLRSNHHNEDQEKEEEKPIEEKTEFINDKTKVNSQQNL